MFQLVAILTFALFAAAPDAAPSNIFARLGLPKMETSDFRIHVTEAGRWSIQHSQVYCIDGLEKSEVDSFVSEMMSAPVDLFKVSSRRSYGIANNRRQFDAKGEFDDVFVLPSLLAGVLQRKNREYFRWDSKSVELTVSDRDLRPASNTQKKTLGEVAADVAFEVIISAALHDGLHDELKKYNLTPAELEAAMTTYEPNSQLILTTDGRITADAPAEISEDGKTLIIDLRKFIADPPETWSIRIDGLQD